MSSLSVRLPDSIHRHIEEIAQKEGISVNQFIASAVAEKLSAIAMDNDIEKRAARADKRAFKDVLSKVPHREPLEGDAL